MIGNYQDVRGVVVKKYKTVLGKYIVVMDENGKKTKIFPGESLFHTMELDSKWTVGHMEGNVVNIRPGFCADKPEDWCGDGTDFVDLILEQLPDAILPWYWENRRELPWRRDREPYHVWISEIMLQQTRVEAVKGYYARFLDALPTVEALANCEDDRLTKLWEGLGYYSRVRNLKKAAQVITETYGGVFPGEYEDILALPGIGEYTAGAVSSICFGKKIAAVDGNVLRVVSRLRDDATPIDDAAYKKQVKRDLEAVYPEAAGDFTQALMELGATVCGPNRKPDCENCPCKAFCLGYQRGTCENLPVKAPKKEKRREERTVFILSCDGFYALTKRPSKGLLAGLWQFPDTAGTLELEEALAYLRENGLEIKEIYRKTEKKHIFTHIQWDMTGYYLEIAEKGGDFCWVTAEELEAEAALPTAYRQFWEDRMDG